VGYFTTNPKKLVLHFSNFSTIFYTIYKKQPKHFYYWSYQLQGGPQKDLLFCNVIPGGGRPARLAGIRRARLRSRTGEGGGRLKAHLGVDLVGRTGAERLRRASTPATSGGGCHGCPERRAFGREGQQAVGVASRGLAEMEKGYFGLGSARNRSSPRLAKGAGGGSVWAGRASTRRGHGPWLLLRRQAHPLKTSGQVKDASGTRAPDDGERTAGP
jgi:hypothetical protein